MRTKKDQQGFVIIGSVSLVLIAIFALKAAIGTGPKPGPDNCIGDPASNTVVVIDHSDGVSRQTIDEIRARAQAWVRDSVGPNDRVTIFAVDELSQNNLTPLVSVCRPRRQGNRAIENVRALEKRFQTRYEAPLDSALRLAPGTSPQSPLAQSLIDVSLSHYLRGSRNTLLVFSDMMENTPRFSLYRCSSPESVVHAFRASRVGSQERPSFRNTMVRLNIIPRLDQSRSALECRDKLWLWFFGDNPGEHAGLSIDYLPGGQATHPTAKEVRR